MTAEELYSIINAEIEEKAKHDSRISLLKRRIENGSASIAEAVEYNQLVNEIMAKSLSGKVLGTDQREELCKMLLKDSYDKSNEALSTAQRGVDAKTGLNIQPKKASFPAERVDTVAKSLTDTTVEDSVIQRRAENAVENVANSFSVDYIKENAKFRTDAGIKCYLERTTNNKDCCKWCTKMAGRYEYATAPDEVFAYHDKCKCILTYVYGRTSKVVWDGNKKINPKKKKNKKPRVISKDEAKKLESENINYKGLKSEKSVDKSGESGIIKSGAISGGLIPDSEEAQVHAERYYESVRKMKTDISNISRNTGFSEAEISQIKNHVFIDEHDLGGDVPERFYPNYAMSQSWQRLIDGKNIQKHDITLLNHEKMESELMKQNYSQKEAHELTEKVYNYAKESREYYAEINKHRQK